MSKRTVFTTVTPLPAGVTRQIVLDFLHDHEEMIDLNPLVKERHPIPTPRHASVDELDCQWFSLTDKISYFPGVSSDVTYTCAFHQLSNGLQTHCYAPAGLTIRDKWTVGGALPGEPAQPAELGLKVPPTGLYLREDVDIRCNVIMASFVKKTLKKSHAALVERLRIKAEIASSDASGGVAMQNPPATARSTVSTASTVSSHQSYQSLSAPTSRPSSAASSVTSATPSPTTQRTPSWSQSANSSAATTPATSAKSSPTFYQTQNQTQNQRQHQPSPQPNPSFSAPRTATAPTSVLAPAAASLLVPNTPFLRHRQPDWPLQQPQQRQRPQIELFTTTTTTAPAPATSTSTPYLGTVVSTQSQQAPAARDSAYTAYSSNNRENSGALPGDALWQALGGGRFMSGAIVSGTGVAAGAVVKNEGSRERRGHPEYPEMSPYDEDDGEDDQDRDGVPACLAVGGRRGVRPVSSPVGGPSWSRLMGV